jgi:uncharacterized protein (TIGR00251 family)
MDRERLQELLRKDVIEVVVHARSRKNAVERIDGSTVHLSIAAPPQDGKANAQVERYLSRLAGRRARIIAGASTPRKLVRLCAGAR